MPWKGMIGMDNNWEKYGREIRSIVDNAIHTQNFQQLNKNITDSVNGAVNDIQNGIRAAGQAVTEATGWQKQMRRINWPGRSFSRKTDRSA